MWANYKNRTPLPRFPLWLRIVWPIAFLVISAILGFVISNVVDSFSMFFIGALVAVLGYLCLLLSELENPPRPLFVIITILSGFATILFGIFYFNSYINHHPAEEQMSLMMYTPCLFTLLVTILSYNNIGKDFWGDLITTLVPLVPMLLIGFLYTQSNIVIFIIVTAITLVIIAGAFSGSNIGNHSSSSSSVKLGINYSKLHEAVRELEMEGYQVKITDSDSMNPHIRLISYNSSPITQYWYDRAVDIIRNHNFDTDYAHITLDL